MNKEEFILNIRPANGEPSKEYVMRLNTKLLLENEQLQQKVKHLEANWDELKGWLKANDIHYAEAIPFRETLNKMQELERGKE